MNNDTVSRRAAIDAFRKELCGEREYATPFISFNGCERILNELPSAERHGQWILHISGLFPAEITMECDQCHEEQPITCDGNYCPNCGAKMEEGGE